MTHHHFVLHQGYVEDQSMACLVLSHEEGFSTPEEAMEDWYQLLLELAQERLEKRRSCCEESLTFSSKRYDTVRFCCFCGQDLKKIPTGEDLVPMVWDDIWKGTNDSVGNSFFERAQEAGWGFEWPSGKYINVFRVDLWVQRWDGEPESRLIWSSEGPA